MPCLSGQLCPPQAEEKDEDLWGRLRHKERPGLQTPRPHPQARLRPAQSFINLMNHKASQVLKKNQTIPRCATLSGLGLAAGRGEEVGGRGRAALAR